MTRFVHRLAVTAALSLSACAPAFAHPSLRAPANVRASTGTQLVLSWSAVRGARRYEVGLASGAADRRPVRAVLGSVGPHTLRWVDRQARAGDTRRYRVRACARGGCSSWSRVVQGTALGVSPTPPAPSLTPGPAPSFATSPQIGGCPIFPSDNPFNQDVSSAAVDPRSDAYIASINRFGDQFLHADFGADPTYGIPYTVVHGSPLEPVSFNEYGDESDPGPYPIGLDAPIEAGNDHHVLAVDADHCKLYELYHAHPADSGWVAGSGAVFDLRSNALRPDTWTSTDQAGLPILPALVRYDEVAAGHIDHALRFSVPQTQHAFIHPATHAGDSSSPDDPPMGLRMRLKASFEISGYHGQARVVLEALRRYGMFVADTGTGWFITGTTDGRWNDEDLNQLKSVPGSAFEAVHTGAIIRPTR